MSKLKLTDIQKIYKGAETVRALKGISLEFRESEFVSILGPSGCGKTTLLNIIGGLDRYNSGDLILSGLSAKNFKDADWDAYRNRSIGFVFQSYNLISHQTVLQNVEIAMALSGVSTLERRKRAKEALASVGLSDQIRKKPNQLSGGQMQRVAIARALVNNPEIILADEPTGALDSRSGTQIMDILKEISKTRLVIMVTHNSELAEEYSSRIIRLLDGEVQSDTNPVSKDEPKEQSSSATKNPLKRTSMSMVAAAVLSYKNLLTKKGRTVITAFAGSIGIIGIALVLALSNGLSSYIDQMQSETLSGFPLTVSRNPITIEMEVSIDNQTGARTNAYEKFTDEDIIHRYNSESQTRRHTNILTQEYFDYVDNLQNILPNAVNSVSYTREAEINVLAKAEDTVVKYETSGGMNPMMQTGGSYWQEIPGNEEFILSLYDLIGENSRLPQKENEIALVVDEYNRINDSFFKKLGFAAESATYNLTDFIGKSVLKVIPNDLFYTQTEEGLFEPASPSQYGKLYNGDGIELTITGILRVKESAAAAIGYLSEGIVYTTALTDAVLRQSQNSEIAAAQKNSDFDVISNVPFASADTKKQRLLSLGAESVPTGVSIYPKNYDAKQEIIEYLDAYNIGKNDQDQIICTDMSEIVASMTGTLINTVSYVLIGFTAISLLVSTIMISIITYVSVLERTKEIGILRSVGARKKDITRVFNAETLIIGLVAGLMGIGVSLLLTLPINMIISSLAGIGNIANLAASHSVILILGSMTLTLIAGFIPSKMAAKKDPVTALRTE